MRKEIKKMTIEERLMLWRSDLCDRAGKLLTEELSEKDVNYAAFLRGTKEEVLVTIHCITTILKEIKEEKET